MIMGMAPARMLALNEDLLHQLKIANDYNLIITDVEDPFSRTAPDRTDGSVEVLFTHAHDPLAPDPIT